MGIIYFIYLITILFLIFKNVHLPFIFKIKYRIPLSIKEKEILKYYYGIDDLSINISRYKDLVFHNCFLVLPLVLVGIFIDVGFVFLAAGVLVGVYRLEYYKLKKVVDKRRIDFYKEYPGFLNSLKLYLESGFNLENALYKYFMDRNSSYYLTLIKSGLDKISYGFNRREAFMEIILRTRERELIKLINFFIRYYMIGGDGHMYLNQIGEEAWKLKKETVKRLAEEASAKMVLPMMLIFIGVCILVLVPSVFSIVGGNVF